MWRWYAAAVAKVLHSLLAGLKSTAGDVLAGTTAEIQDDTNDVCDARLLPKSVIDNAGPGPEGQWRDAARQALAGWQD